VSVVRFPLEPEKDNEDEAQIGATPVTLCIAGACQYRNKPMIVTCTDWKVSSSFGASETADKLRWLKPPNWIALTAGGAASADALVRAYRAGLKDKPITEDNATQLFNEVAVGQMTWMKNNLVERLLGVTYEHLRLKGKKEFPESVLLDTYIKLREVNLGASLIVAGFVPHQKSMKPLICKIDRRGEVTVTDHFEAIGEGRNVANPPLLRRQYTSDVSLMDAIYRLYEAKKLAEIVPSVGEDTSIDILFPTGEMQQLRDPHGFDVVEKMFRKYGPRLRIEKPAVKRQYFEELDFERLH
jgi:20S proteasome alpha/beta subunit